MRPGTAHTPTTRKELDVTPDSIAPQLSADGTAVRLPLTDRVAPLLDELALAYAEDPATVGTLLLAHAAAVVCLDYAVCSDDTPDYERAMRAAEADGTRDALTEGLPAAVHVDPLMSPHDAITLGTRLTKSAAAIRNSQNRNRA
jgi:hypothetical protein